MGRAKRDLGQEILQALRDIKAGQGKRTILFRPHEVSAVREKLQLSQQQLAALIGVSVRTLQAWEQGRRRPSRAALALLAIASARPDVVHEVLRPAN
jgi:putative transcriptional regulator